MTRLAAAVALVVAVSPPAAVQPVETVAGVVKAVAAGKNQLVVTVEEGDVRADRTVTAGGAKVLFGSEAVALGDLRPGMHVALSYRGNSTDLLAVKAAWPPREVVFQAADPAGRSFRTDADEVLTLDPAAKMTVDELPAGVADVPPGRKVRLELALDRTVVRTLEAEGAPDTLPGLVKRYDAATRTLLVEVRAAGFRADRVATIGFAVAAGAKVRRAGRDVALTDLKERMPVRLTFTADRRTVTAILTAAPLPPELNDDD